MFKLILLPICIIYMVLWINPVFAEEFFWFYEASVDAKSLGLGQTSLLNSSEGSYLYDNPAKLGLLKETHLSLNLRYMQEKETTVFTGSANPVYNYDLKYPNTIRIAPFTVSFNTKIFSQNGLSVGIGYRKLYDYQFEKSEGTDVHVRESDIKTGVNFLSFGLGTELHKKVYAGFNWNFAVNNKYEYSEVEEHIENGYSYTDKNKEEITGSYVSFALNYTPLSFLELAGNLRPGYSLESKSTVTQTESQNSIVQVSKSTATLSIPTKITLGIKVKPIQLLDLTCEYNNNTFSEYKIKDYSLYNWKSKEGSNWRFGMALNTCVPIRFGYFMDSIGLYDAKFDPADSTGFKVIKDNNPLTIKGFTLGTGLKITKSLNADLGYCYAKFAQKNTKSYSYLTEDYKYTTKLDYSAHKLLLTLEYVF